MERPIQIRSEGKGWAVVGVLLTATAFLFLLSARGITIPQLLNGTTPPAAQQAEPTKAPKDTGRNLGAGQPAPAAHNPPVADTTVGSPPNVIPTPAPLPETGGASLGPQQPAISDAEIGKPGESPVGSGGGFFDGVKAGGGAGACGGVSVVQCAAP